MVGFKELTLREGSQVPGLEIDDETGKRVLDELARLEVDCVEVSFPRAHPRGSWYRHADDLELRTAALSRAVSTDIDAALAVESDEIEVIVNASDVQLEHALGKTRDEALDLLVENIERAIDGGADVGLTLMDAMRANEEFLTRGATTAVEAGAKHVTLADTTGSGTLERVRETVSAVTTTLDGAAPVAVHTHDDMGVATANAVVGVSAGASKVDATVGGIGERAGNAPIEEIAVLLAERGDDPALALEELVPVSLEVHELLGVDVPPGKAVFGERAYRHESGLHTAAMLREPSTYEAFDPARYGGDRELLFGDDTGRGAVRAVLADLGVNPTDDRIKASLERIRAAKAEKSEPLSESETRSLLAEAEL